jgi:hypothetical protein
MEKIYSKKKRKRTLLTAKPETVEFLLAYSKSLKITKAEGIEFESNLN